MQIDKITAAKHQLDTAIDLFFLDRDPISIRTLLSSAWNVLHDLLAKTDLESSRDWITKSFPDHSQKEIMGILKHDWSFFKHADRDPERILKFDDRANQELLMFAVNDFAQLTKATTFIMEVYQLWFIAKNEAIFENTKHENLFEFAQSVFPNLSALGSTQQKELGRNALGDSQLYQQHLEGRYLLSNNADDNLLSN